MQENNLIDTLSNLGSILKKNVLWIIALSLFIAIPSALIEKAKKPIFQATSKIFPLSASSEGGTMNAIKAQLGIAESGDASKIYNINELMSSKNLSHNIVNMNLNNKYKKLAYWLIDDYNNGMNFWGKKIKIPTKDTLECIYIASDILLNNTSISLSKSDFTTITTKSYNDTLAIELNKSILQELSDFYIRTKTEKAREDINKLSKLKDSIKNMLDMTEKAIAGNMDASRYVVESSAGLPQMRLERLHEEYIEQYKSASIALQNANFKLLSESPIFQVLDKPIRPLNTIYPNWKKTFVLSFIFSALVFSLLFLRKQLWQIILDELKKA